MAFVSIFLLFFFAGVAVFLNPNQRRKGHKFLVHSLTDAVNIFLQIERKSYEGFAKEN